MKPFWTRAIAIAAAILLVLSMVPLFAIAVDNYPSADDFGACVDSHAVYMETGSLFQAVKAAFAHAHAFYLGWQGTFAAAYISVLQPCLVGTSGYWLTAMLLLVIFVLSNLVFCRAFLPGLGFDLWTRIITASLLVFAGIQLMPSPVEGFYWYSGSILYTLFYCFSLLYASLLAFAAKKAARMKNPWYWAGLIVLGVLIGGGNFSTALAGSVLMVLYVAYLCIRRQARPLHFAALAALLIAFGFNVFSPGNATRSAAVVAAGGSMPAVKAVLSAIRYAALHSIRMLSPQMLVLTALAVPFFWKSAANVPFSFRRPFLITLGSILLLAVELTPPLYALGHGGPARLFNVVHFTFVILLFFNVYYYLGWAQKRMCEAAERSGATGTAFLNSIGRSIRKHVVEYLAIIAMAFLLVCAFDSTYKSFTSVQAVFSLRNGEAEVYGREMRERFELLSDATEKDVTVPALTAWPSLLYLNDLDADPAHWINVSVAKYFGKDVVRVETN